MDHQITRRRAVGALLAGSAAACAPKTNDVHDSTRNRTYGAFAHGIASGDPLTDRIILWTRITPENARLAKVDVSWEISKSENFGNITASGTQDTNASRNWTVKVDAAGLKPGQWYYYRFKIDDNTSPIGRTRTLPEGKTNKARFAVVSCANWQQGYFNAYDHIAREQSTSKKFDALVHLGDYFYEYDESKCNKAMRAAGRLHEPRHEVIELDDYRIRHAQYRSDPSLQALTAQMPMIAIWDDHESSNDSWKDGAENHSPDEGDWEARKLAAMRAYYEWMPVRDPKPGRGKEFLFRSFEWGDLITMCAVETRLLARSESFEFETYFDELMAEGGLEKFKQEKMLDPAREMLGKVQQDWIIKTFGTSKENGKPWRVLANQVLMGKLNSPDMTPYFDAEEVKETDRYGDMLYKKLKLSPFRLPLYPDCWDGYPAARERLYKALKTAGVEDMFVLTGDSHEFWVNDLINDGGDKIGVEIGTTSVSSETTGDVIGESARDYALLVTQENEGVRYYNPMKQGYLDLSLTPKKGVARLMTIDTVSEPQYSASEMARFDIVPEKSSLKFSSPKELSLKQRALFHGFGE